MASEFAAFVLRGALFAGLAVLLLLRARRLLRRRLGAALAYQAWLLLPCVLIAAMLPASPAPRLLHIEALDAAQALAVQATPGVASQQANLLLLAWACGALAMALRFVLGHHAFLRQAGRLTPSGEVYIGAAGIGPASVGLLRPRIVVPPDFAQRYAPAEQALIIAHERTHIARRDALANLLAALLQCAFWFNPLVHLGARAFRQDQELACDAAVMRRHPGQRRSYAEALLKSHTGAHAAGLHCHWQSPHPTKERIMSLSHTPPGTARRLAGRCILALLAASAIGATLSVRAELPAQGPVYAIAMQLDEGGKRSTPRVLARAGETFAVATDAWRLEMTVRQAETPGQVWLKGALYKGKEQVGAPTLLARVGEAATVKVGEGIGAFAVSMTVSPQS